jgi:hypothetical protein
MQVRIEERDISGIVRAQFFAASAAVRGRNLSEAAKYVDSFVDGCQTPVQFRSPPFLPKFEILDWLILPLNLAG